MSKLPRDVAAFARRVKMGTARLWVLVEGRDIDGAFYDRLLTANPSLEKGGYSLRAVEHLELNNKSAGGKPFAYKLFEFFSSRKVLSQTAKSGRRSIVFALDRDYEDVGGTLRQSPHIIYTAAVDVEAEILTNGNMRSAISSAYSVPTVVVSQAVEGFEDVSRELARRWRVWITFRAIAACSQALPGVQNAAHSQVNTPVFGDVDYSKVKALDELLLSSVEYSDLAQAKVKAEQIVEELYDSGREAVLVKGKWLVSFIHHLMQSPSLDWPNRSNVAAGVVSKTCMETLDFTAPWSLQFHEKVSLLVDP